LSDFLIEGGILKKYRGNAKEVIIPDNVIEIADGAFSNCLSVTSIVIPEGVKVIRSGWFGGRASGRTYSAFLDCPNLTDVSLPSSLDDISLYTFARCSKLKNIKIAGDISSNENWGLKLPNDFCLINETSRHYYYKSESKECFALVFLYFVQGVKWTKDVYSKSFEFQDVMSFENRPIYVNGVDVVQKLYPLAAVEYERRKAEIEKEAKKLCYIATAVYGDYDAPQVLILRHFRDNTLSKSAAGRLFIKAYYRFSSPIARRLKTMRHLNAAVRGILDRFVSYLSRK
jgi:hypothetical protein